MGHPGTAVGSFTKKKDAAQLQAAAGLCDHGGADRIFSDSGPFAPAAGALGSDFDDLRGKHRPRTLLVCPADLALLRIGW